MLENELNPKKVNLQPNHIYCKEKFVFREIEHISDTDSWLCRIENYYILSNMDKSDRIHVRGLKGLYNSEK